MTETPKIRCFFLLLKPTSHNVSILAFAVSYNLQEICKIILRIVTTLEVDTQEWPWGKKHLHNPNNRSRERLKEMFAKQQKTQIKLRPTDKYSRKVGHNTEY